MLGPTLPPGGGAEVLPAGIVNNPSAVSSTWLSTPTFSRYSNDQCVLYLRTKHPHSCLSCSWTLPTLPISHPPSPSSSSAPVTYQHVSTFDHLLPSSASLSTSTPNFQSLVAPNAGGLPVYSASGFDLMSVLARVVTRPNPKIVLGPVDMTCSFVVVDVRRYDSPIVYASPTFCKLTGYAEHEVIGRNCRFLQSPDGVVQRGEPRQHTAQEAVTHMRKSLTADKECQASLINYRKDGSAFVNLVTVIPIRGGIHNMPEEADDVVYQIGFQVDLTEQPNAILQKLRDGSYMVNYSNEVALPFSSSKSGWRINSSSGPGVSKSLRALLNSPDFLHSIPFSTSTTTLSIAPQERSDKSDIYDGNKPLSLLLLESSPDFIQVLSLKGAFLYVSPSVRRVLGYAPEDLVGMSITDFCHEADKIPLVRELKESSASLASAASVGTPPQESQPSSSQQQSFSSPAVPKVVDLLFRIRVKDSTYVWLECRGRLYVEPGKGRKAIILSGRVRSMASLAWASIARAGGLAPSVRREIRKDDSSVASQEHEQEFWALLSSGGSFLFASTAVRDVLGWGAGEIMGSSLCDFIGGHDPMQGRLVVEETLHLAFTDSRLETRNVSCYLNRKDGSQLAVDVVLYHTPRDNQPWRPASSPSTPQRPLMCQVKVLGETTSSSTPVRLCHSNSAYVFDELDPMRDSSWQYELQQLKYANQRLREELDALEAHIHRESETQLRARVLHERSQHRPSSSCNATWAGHMQNVNELSGTASKRTWNGDIVGYGYSR
ncbi:hypothetical protein BC835DRAFT_1271027 [Cytidiella melzeri]|nr:hypothetical protein BC835DRAFT_1271027 [Cytidiella melzeri]